MEECLLHGLPNETRLLELSDRDNGVNFGDCMKQPRLNNLKINEKATLRLRQQMAATKKIKITINIDQDSLVTLKSIALKAGSSYQKLLNQILKEGLEVHRGSDARLDRLEKEIEKLKRKIA